MYESREGTSDFQTSEFRIPSDFRLQTSDFFRIETSDFFRIETSDLRIETCSDFRLRTPDPGYQSSNFHSLLLCTNMDDVSRLPYRGALRGKKDYVGASFGLQFK